MAKTKEKNVESAPEKETTMDLNAGMIMSFEEIARRRDEDRKRISEERAAAKAAGGESRLTLHKFLPDTPALAKFLTLFENGGSFWLHPWIGGQRVMRICRQHMGEACPDCLEAQPQAFFLIPAYLYNLVGKTFPKMVNGEEKFYKYNPNKIVAVPHGSFKDPDCNRLTFANADRLKFFQTEIWQLQHLKGVGFALPAPITVEAARKLAGSNFSLELPEAATKIGTLTKKELFAIYLHALKATPEDMAKLGVEVSAAVDTETPKNEKTASDILDE